MKEKQIYPFLDKRIEDYCQTYVSPESDSLKNLTRETHIKFLRPNMISGNWQGHFLSMISNLVCPKKILEIGTFTGYSTICLAQGLPSDGILHTIEVNVEMEAFLRDLFAKNNLSTKIELHIGNAMDIVNDMDNDFDLIFIDADKVNYPFYYDICIEKLNKNGVILIDNVLWYGRVALDEMPEDKETKAIHEFNVKITQDKRIENLILPIRDGIMMGRRI